MRLSAPVHRLKHKAKLIARQEKIPLNAALDRVAAAEGFARWSLLAARLPPSAAEIHGELEPGDLVLIGARPGHGKTLMALKLAVEAMKRGADAAVFTLEYARRDVDERLLSLGVDPQRLEGRLLVDTSDGICADHVIGALGDAKPGTLAVVDYLQLLDQRRENPDLAAQVWALKDFARRRGIIIVFVSQIDRSYDRAARRLPDARDIRLPNPLDLALFDRMLFLDSGAVRFGPSG